MMISWSALNRTVDLYCERTDASFWAEPLNALSNFAFVLAGLVFLREAQKSKQLNRTNRALGCLAVAIGFGSFWFHTEATLLAQFGDLLPIFLFTAYLLWLELQRSFQMQKTIATAFTFGLTFAMGLGPAFLPRGFLNGSGLYLPIVLALFVLAYHAKANLKLRSSPNWLASALIFCGSLVFRSVDNSICDVLPTGTHFLWHIFNSVLIFTLLKIRLAPVHFQQVSVAPQ